MPALGRPGVESGLAGGSQPIHPALRRGPPVPAAAGRAERLGCGFDDFHRQGVAAGAADRADVVQGYPEGQVTPFESFALAFLHRVGIGPVAQVLTQAPQFPWVQARCHPLGPGRTGDLIAVCAVCAARVLCIVGECAGGFGGGPRARQPGRGRGQQLLLGRRGQRVVFDLGRGPADYVGGVERDQTLVQRLISGLQPGQRPAGRDQLPGPAGRPATAVPQERGRRGVAGGLECAGGIDQACQPGQLPEHLVGEHRDLADLDQQAKAITRHGAEGGQLSQHLVPRGDTDRIHIRRVTGGSDKMLAAVQPGKHRQNVGAFC